jgi:hypothetical protein
MSVRLAQIPNHLRCCADTRSPCTCRIPFCFSRAQWHAFLFRWFPWHGRVYYW